MAQFIAFNTNVEVNKQTVLSVVNSMETGKQSRLEILLENGINPEEKEWFNQQKWLNALKTISDTLGEMNLFLIGKAIIENAQLPPINNLEEALRGIDVGFPMNHRLNGKVMFDFETGEMLSGIGNYKLVEFDAENQTAVMCCNNSYPSRFDEGIITQFVRKFKPPYSSEEITLDTTKETRLKGGDSCTFLISW